MHIKLIMAFRLLLIVSLVAACSLTVLAQADDDFAEFDDEEGEFDFDMPGELVLNSLQTSRRDIFCQIVYDALYKLIIQRRK